jgi:hypothetical protein
MQRVGAVMLVRALGASRPVHRASGARSVTSASTR